MTQALFVELKNGRWLRLTDWVNTPTADRLFAKVADYNIGPRVTLQTNGGENIPVNRFALRPHGGMFTGGGPVGYGLWNDVPHFQGHGIVRRWSERAYVDDVRALQAWNREKGVYKGAAGGWLYNATTGNPVVHGWSKAATRLRMKLLPGKDGVRYATEEVNVLR